MEAGTEAALMRSELVELLGVDEFKHYDVFDVPFFLDTEDLRNLDSLLEKVRQSHNLAVLLSKNVLTRPWVLLEIVTAVSSGVRVLPVELLRAGNVFEYPDESFYSRIRDGSFFDDHAKGMFRERSIDWTTLENALREVFQCISVSYSPHRAASIRKAELSALMKRCRINEEPLSPAPNQ